MKAVFGVISLLVVLAIVGLVASRQMKAVTVVPPTVGAGSSPAAANVAEQSRQIQNQVRNELNNALQQGAQRTDEADK